METLGDDAGTSSFVRCRGVGGEVDGPVVSREALRLHVYAVLVSIESGRPGLIEDAYLNSLTVETSVRALELCTAGLWTRTDDGYSVRQGETMRIAAEVHRQLQDLSGQCRSAGGHAVDLRHDDRCGKCGVQLS